MDQSRIAQSRIAKAAAVLAAARRERQRIGGLPEDVRPQNLAALCQRCHNRHDAKSRANGIRLRAMATRDLLEAAGVTVMRA